MPWLDALIAAIAIHDCVRVYSIDKHFRGMAEICPDLLLYEPGYGGRFVSEDE